ncbi:MAG TPA: aspartyl protease family protein [Chitinophagaceae bacterium]|jgi:hypothetical protein|nr:aspartyl protease family protein [Chitinophagaceae bacterium]
MIRRLLYLICLLVSGLRPAAQEEFIEPARFLTRIPFMQLTGGVILMKAQVGTFSDTLNFILDSGSGGISLDSATVAYFGLKPVPSDRTIRGIAGVRQVSFLYNQKLHLPRLTIDSLNFHINNYDILTSVYGEQIDGIIGYSVLSRYILKINFDSSFIEFWSKGTLKYPKGGYLLKPVISTLPVNSARVRDAETINARFLFDMGAGMNMLLSNEFIRDSGLLHRKRKLYAKEAEGLGGKVDMAMTVIREVKLGPYKFRNVPVFVFDDTYNVTSYPVLGGLIGNDLLRRFNLILNYEKRDFHLLPNSHFAEPFDYSYTGIELYYQNGLVLIGDVAKGSPAEAAGLQEGDIVVSVNKILNQGLQAYKNALQNVRDKIKLIVNRNGNLVEIEFRVKSIMESQRWRK